MNKKAVIRDTLILFVLTMCGGLIVGVATAMGGLDEQNETFLLAFSNVILTLVGFTIVGCLTKENVLKHVTIVAFFSWLLGLLNIFFGVSLVHWVAGILLIMPLMFVGYGLSSVLKKLFLQ